MVVLLRCGFVDLCYLGLALLVCVFIVCLWCDAGLLCLVTDAVCYCGWVWMLIACGFIGCLWCCAGFALLFGLLAMG